MFQEAVEAIQAGQRARARDLLTRLLRTEQKNAKYWVYLSTVVDSDKERRYCLENALKIEPNNRAAQRGMVLLGFSPPDPQTPTIRPSLGREWTVSEVLDATGEAQSTKKQFKPIPWANLITVIALFTVVGALMLVGVFGNPFYSPPAIASGPTPTVAPLITAGPSPTPVVTAGFNVSIDFGATPTFDGPTPLVFFLDATYTPTALYVVTEHPSSETFALAMTAFERRNWEVAVEYFEEFIQDNPEQYDARYYLGLAYYELGENLKAKDSLLKAINVNPDFGPAYTARARVDLALNPNGNFADDLNTGIQLAPDFVVAYLTRAEYRLQRKNYEGVIQDAEAALGLEPENAQAYYYLGEASMLLEEIEDALEFAVISNELDFTILRNYFVIGYTLVETGQVANAVFPLQTYLNYETEDADAWLLLGRAQQAAGFHQSAVTIFEHVLELDGTLREVDYYRGLSELELGEYEAAVASFENAILLFPNWVEPKLQLGRAQFLSGEVATGYSTLQVNSSLARSDEQRAFIYYWRALTLEALDDFPNADNDWRRLLALPDEAVPDEWARTANNHLAGVYETPQATPSITVSGTTSATPTGTLSATSTRTPTPTTTPTP